MNWYINHILKLYLHSMTGVKAYMTGKIKVKGDLLLAQRLEGVFEALGGREVSHFLFFIF